MKTILVTGGAGFIGSAVCRLLTSQGQQVICLDNLTYAAAPGTLEDLRRRSGFDLVHGDICDRTLLERVLAERRPDAIMHLAAESHVDRSIDGAAAFIQTNILGTYHLLEAALEYWRALPADRQSLFRFHHVSTDEVYGDLPFDDTVFREDTPYRPSSPYSASKAASDHLVHAWHRTHGLPIVTSNCSNNYGPYHFPEKLIPVAILSALHERPIPVYGRGTNVRDWLFVEDHARALELVLSRGRSGEGYNIGGRAERSNLSVVHDICDLMDKFRPRPSGKPHRDLIEFVSDRPGHDLRYAIDPSKAESELGWRAQESFESGLRKTVRWFLDNREWWQPLIAQARLGQRLGDGN